MKDQIEKQAIEEMAKMLWHFPKTLHLNCYNDCAEAAELLYNEGYRKQSEKKKTKGCEYCKGRAYTKKPLTVITKYGRRIELSFEYCPNCGRKMKGGAE